MNAIEANNVSKSYGKVKALDDYSTILLQLSGSQDSCSIVVELMNESGSVIKRERADSNGTAQFFYVNPGNYYARAFADRNDNGTWDTGRYDDDLQPEAVYYFPKSIEAKAKWDITRVWNLTALPRHRQKPSVLVKQKATDKKAVSNRNAERARQLGIEYIKQQTVK